MSKPSDWDSVRNELAEYLSFDKEFQTRFKTARSRLANLKKTVPAAVARSEWFTDLFHELDPTYFMLRGDQGVKPGRQLKKQPSSKIGMVRYGFDARDRLVLVEKCGAWDEYREHRPGRIDTARFHWDKKCLEIQTLFLDGDSPAAYVNFDGTDLVVRKYCFGRGKIVSVPQATKQIWLKDAPWKFHRYDFAKTKTGVLEIRYQGEGYRPQDVLVFRYLPPSAPNVKTPPPELDLRKDLKKLPKLIAQITANFAKLQKSKKPLPAISAFGLDFQYYNNGAPAIFVHFHTRPSHPDDGSWSHGYWRTIDRPEWQQFWDEQAAHKTGGFIIDTRGKRHRVPKNEDSEVEPAPWFGQLLVEALKIARKEKHFKMLSQTERCEFSIGDNDDGAYIGWNNYNERK